MRAALRALLPAGVEGAERLDATDVQPLFPVESESVAQAVDKRRLEFALGRTCAREALERLGLTPLALPKNPDRSVQWPGGFVGSITHADGYVAALAAPVAVARGLGIDAEVKARVHDKLWPQIATADEIAWFEQAESELHARERATCVFSAKEAFYKAQYCISRAWVGFHDVHVTFFDADFEVNLLVDIEGLAARGTRYRGRYLTLDDHVITVLPMLTSPR